MAKAWPRNPAGSGKHEKAQAFIAANLDLVQAPGVPEVRLYRAHPRSGLSRLCGEETPYWAYGWAGGTVLARYILDHPESVAGRRVLDIGTGSGIVAIAAAKAGAARVIAADIDGNAMAALVLNAAANGVTVEGYEGDVTTGAPSDVDLILGGDVFYSAVLASRMADYLRRFAALGIAILIGDPGRASLPLERLRAVAKYEVPDFGIGGRVAAKVFAFKDQGTGPLDPATEGECV